MPRIPTHITETKSRQIFERAITNYQCEDIDLAYGDVLFRQETERDYGVDGCVELLRYGEPTGRRAYIQLKGTEKVIERLKRSEEVSCAGISRSNLLYCRQNNIPVMLVYVSTADGKFYYLDLQSVYQEKLEEIEDGKTVTVRIPVRNNSEDLKRFFEIINHYYSDKDAPGLIPNRPVKEVNPDEDEQIVTMDDTYIAIYPELPCDGEHDQINSMGFPVAPGLWKNGRLEKGMEYDWMIHVTSGYLIYKPDCPEDPYDASEGFVYEKLEQYAWEAVSPFSLSIPHVEHYGINQFYVVDLEVDGDMEQITNIRTLSQFLQERNPQLLCSLRELYATEFQGAST